MGKFNSCILPRLAYDVRIRRMIAKVDVSFIEKPFSIDKSEIYFANLK